MLELPSGYALRSGSSLDRALLVKFMQRTYQENFPGAETAHLARTVDQYLSKQTPLWWIDWRADEIYQTIAGLWLGNAVDQTSGNRHAHIFLLYVSPPHRRQGLASVLMQEAEQWAAQRGDRQIGLQVFTHNQPALQLYEQRGYQPQSVTMLKKLG